MVVWSSLVLLAAVGQDDGRPPSLAGRGDAEAQSEASFMVDDVEVRGRRGAAGIAPELELGEADIDALGAYDIGEVLGRLTEQLAPGEEPMVLINGRLVPNAGVFSRFPPDALVRAEILPREATSLLGGRPGQRVVNLVLQRRFSSLDVLASGARPTAGGTSVLTGDLRRSAISGNDTYQAGVRVSRQTALQVDDRKGRDVNGGMVTGTATLRPRIDAVAANLSLTRMLGDWSGSFTLNGQKRDSLTLLRFGQDLQDVRRRTDSLAGTAGLSGRRAGWSLQLGFAGQVARSSEEGRADSRSEVASFTATGAANRTLFTLPKGPASMNLSGQVSVSRSKLEAESARRRLSAWSGDVRGSLSVPLSRGGEDTLEARLLGDVLATVGGDVRQGDTGEGNGLNAALSWVPRRDVRVIGVWSTATESVSDSQRFDPIHYGAPLVVFDFRTGEAVQVTPVLGGNPELRPSRFERLSLTASLGPWTSWSLAGSVGFQQTRNTDSIGALPALTEEVEAAFPERFSRDSQGRLLGVDQRPLNTRSVEATEVVSSMSLSLPGREPGLSSAASLRLTLNHTWRLRSRLSLHAGLPEMDRLAGDGGGVPRQDISFVLDGRHGRWGVNATGRWQGGSRIRRWSGRDGSGDLLIDPFASIDLRASLQLNLASSHSPDTDQPTSARRRSAGLFLDLEVENLFDERPDARLGDGAPAPGYGRDMQDPLGRTLRLTLKRRF